MSVNSKRQRIMTMLRNPEGRNKAQIARYFGVSYQMVINAEHNLDRESLQKWIDESPTPSEVEDCTVAYQPREIGLFEEFPIKLR